MQISKTFSLALLGMMILAFAPFTAKADAGDHPGWTTNYEEAKAQAKKEGKKLMLKFTGSDWCPPCQYMWKNVFSKDSFNEAALKDYVLVYLDYPRNDYRSADLKKQNELLQKQYAISSYPTVIVADAEGETIYSASGAKQGMSPQQYVTWLSDQTTKMESLMAKIKKAEPAEQMKLMDQTLSDSTVELPEATRVKFMEKIVELDADGKAGLKAKYSVELNFNKLMTSLNDGSIQSPDEAMKAVEAFMADNKVEGEMLQQALVIKGQILGSKNDLIGLYEAFKAAHDAAPDSQMAARIKQALPQIKAAIDKANPSS